MRIENVTDDNQRSKDWRIERLGCWTGSRVGELMKAGRNKGAAFSDTGMSYIYEVMAERDLSSHTIGNDEMWQQYLDLTSATSKAMRFGTDNESDALDAFWDWFNVEGNENAYRMVRTGSVAHGEIANFAASPDAVIVDNETDEIVAVVEVKCPLPKTFMKYRAEIKDAATLKSAIEQYYYQVHAEMMVTDTRLTYFVTYCPFLAHPLNVVNVERDELTCVMMRDRMLLAEEMIDKLRKNQ